ncbi:MAG: PmoA family protein [Planctomycetes bacterium]|nr:PmoA family protein [Planctomycetota bacterium]
MADGKATIPVIRLTGETLSVEDPAGPRIEVRYRGAGVPKSYVRGIWAGGTNPLLDSPPDHQHHRALMFAWNVDGVEFWGPEGPGCGLLVHTGFRDLAVEAGEARFTEDLDWIAPDGRLRLVEARALRARIGPVAGGVGIDWRSTFRVPPGALRSEITGRAYHGLGIRFTHDWDRVAEFLSADGGRGVEGTNEKVCRWCAVTRPASAGAPASTVAVLAHPTNPRPATWFTMADAFAYISATLAVDRTPLVVDADRPLSVRYFVLAARGGCDVAAIERIWTDWSKGD